jgi:hypothetical protein
MKTIFITIIVVFALTSAATAHTWAWFQGDIGVYSPFFPSSNSAESNVSTSHATKPKAVSKRLVIRSKSKSTSFRAMILSRTLPTENRSKDQPNSPRPTKAPRTNSHRLSTNSYLRSHQQNTNRNLAVSAGMRHRSTNLRPSKLNISRYCTTD